MDADKATTSDDEVAFGWSETLQSLVSGFAEIVVVQTADFGEWFLVMMGAYFGVPRRGKKPLSSLNIQYHWTYANKQRNKYSK